MTEQIDFGRIFRIAARMESAGEARNLIRAAVSASNLVSTMNDIPQSEGDKHYAKREKFIKRMKSSTDRVLNYAKHETLRKIEKHFRDNPTAIHSAESGGATSPDASSSLAARLTFDKELLAPELLAALREDQESALNTAGQQLFDEIGKDSVWRVPSQDAIQFVQDRANLLANVPDEVHSEIMQSIEQGLQQGESRKDLMARISSVFDEIGKGRAETIANTETAAAFNYSREIAMKEAGVTHKRWLHSQSPLIKEPRPTHVEADGQIQPIDDPFDVGGVQFMRPADDSLGAGPEDIINCHCVAIPVEAPLKSADAGGEWKTIRGAHVFIKTGQDIGEVFHGGKHTIDDPTLEHSQQRDYGFYGKGFYVTKEPNYAKTYGGRITKYGVHPDAKVLLSSLKPEDAPKGLVDEVVNWKRTEGLAKAAARGKSEQFEDYLKSIRTDNLEWKNAVDAYGESHGFDIVAHSKGEMVVKNPSVLKRIK